MRSKADSMKKNEISQILHKMQELLGGDLKVTSTSDDHSHGHHCVFEAYLQQYRLKNKARQHIVFTICILSDGANMPKTSHPQYAQFKARVLMRGVAKKAKEDKIFLTALREVDNLLQL